MTRVEAGAKALTESEVTELEQACLYRTDVPQDVARLVLRMLANERALDAEVRALEEEVARMEAEMAG